MESWHPRSQFNITKVIKVRIVHKNGIHVHTNVLLEVKEIAHLKTIVKKDKELPLLAPKLLQSRPLKHIPSECFAYIHLIKHFINCHYSYSGIPQPVPPLNPPDISPVHQRDARPASWL